MSSAGDSQLVYELCQLALGDQDGMAAVFRAYMDESGIHDESPVLTVAAYFARPTVWKAWTKKWNVAKRPIKVYHATDAQHLRGEFEGWSHEQVTELVKRILPVISQEEKLRGIVIGIHMEAFNREMAEHTELKKLFGTPYTACFQWVVQVLLNLQHDAGSHERIAFIHENNDYQHEALTAFNWVKANANPSGSVIGLQFGDKATFAPLQAADILAYEGNRRMRDPARPERRPWTALKESVFAAHYGQNNMHKLISSLEKIREGRLNEIDPGAGWNRARGPLAQGS